MDFRLGNAGKMKRATLTSQARKAFRGSSRGFTLVEVLITIALIGAIGVAFFSFMSAATSALIHADERTIAENLARRQMEYVKAWGYNSTLVGNQTSYPKITGIPPGYTICSVTHNGSVVDMGNVIIGIPWDSANNRTATSNTGLQKIALVIKHKYENNEYKEIYVFINNNPNWAPGVKITLEGYIRQS